MTLKRRSFIQSLAGSLFLVPGLLSFPKVVRTTPRFDEVDDEALWPLVRKSFPLTEKRIYLNAGGLGPSPYQVLEAVNQKQQELETIGETGHHLHDEVREKLAAFIGADASEIAFTRNATEGMNFIARGVPLQAGDEVLTTTHEHPGGAMPWLAVAKDRGIKVRLMEPENDPEKMIAAVKQQINKRTKVLMFSHVTCTLGTVLPARELCALAKANGLVSVIDGAQAVGQIRVDLHELGCDYYTTSGHKWLLGPKESGFIYISKAARQTFQPTFVGAYSDNGYDLDALKLPYRDDAIVTEYGTRSAARVWGIGAAVDFVSGLGMERVENRLRTLATRLKRQLAGHVDVVVLTPELPEHSGGIVTFAVQNLSYSELAGKLGSDYNMRVRVVTEHGINAVRASLHVYISEQEVDALANALIEISKGSKK